MSSERESGLVKIGHANLRARSGHGPRAAANDRTHLVVRDGFSIPAIRSPHTSRSFRKVTEFQRRNSDIQGWESK